jgi:hypothetical protein
MTVCFSLLDLPRGVGVISGLYTLSPTLFSIFDLGVGRADGMQGDRTNVRTIRKGAALDLIRLGCDGLYTTTIES